MDSEVLDRLKRQNQALTSVLALEDVRGSIFVSGLPFAGHSDLIHIVSDMMKPMSWYLPNVQMEDGSSINYGLLLGARKFRKQVWLFWGQPAALSRRFKVRELDLPVRITGTINVISWSIVLQRKSFGEHLKLSLSDDAPFAVLLNSEQTDDYPDHQEFAAQYGLSQNHIIEISDFTDRQQTIDAVDRIVYLFSTISSQC